MSTGSSPSDPGATLAALAGDSQLADRIRFVVELDRLKQVLRRTVVTDGTRRENTAEHSWHVAMMALVLADTADEPVDPMRVARLLLVHDIVEIDAGDTFVYDTDGQKTKAARERAAAERLFGLLPDGQGDELRACWFEFEDGTTAEARFARALDRLQPLLLNHASAGQAWREHGITADQVRAVNAAIERRLSRRCGSSRSASSTTPSRGAGCPRPAVRLDHRFRSFSEWTALGAGLAAARRSRQMDHARSTTPWTGGSSALATLGWTRSSTACRAPPTTRSSGSRSARCAPHVAVTRRSGCGSQPRSAWSRH